MFFAILVIIHVPLKIVKCDIITMYINDLADSKLEMFDNNWSFLKMIIIFTHR